MACSYCEAPKIFARKLCQACYYRLRRNGSVERKNVRNVGLCLAEGCTKRAFAKNLCGKHYTQAQHAMKTTWKLLRNRHTDDFDPAWLDFDKFVEDIGGNRPSPKHQLRRLDENHPYSVDNYRWVEPVLKADGEKFEDRDTYVREWTVRKYGLTLESYDAKLAAQNGVCAICEQPETAAHQKTGKVRVLAIDHCHYKLHVRALLCSRCNLMLGNSRDNPALLRKAADYLEYHASQVGRDPPPE